METAKLFTVEQIKRWFNLLLEKERHQTERYKGYDKNNPHITPCSQEVFIKRTLNKWFSGKYLVLYSVNENTGIQYKRYIYIGSIRHRLGYGDDLSINIIDYADLSNVWNTLKISHNDALRLEGYFCENGEQHLLVSKLFSLEDLTEKEFVYEAYDWDKYQSRGRLTKEQKIDKIKTTVSVFAKTEYEATKKIRKVQEENKNLMIKI